MKTHKITTTTENLGVISVVVPVYNTEKFLNMSLQSLLNQTYPYWEAILVNDGSTDSSLQILQQYAANDKRFKVINKPNGGVASARNKALEFICGKFVAFMDPDDMLFPQFLEIMLKALSENKADMVSCDFKKVPETATLSYCITYTHYQTSVCRDLAKHFICHKHPKIRIACINKVFRRELLENHRFCEEFKIMAEDFHFSMTIFLRIKKSVLIKQKLFAYRQNSTSLSHRPISFRIADDHVLLLEKLIPFYIANRKFDILKKLQRHLSKMVYNYCCLRPYSDINADHFVFWRRYFPKIVMMKENHIFDEKGLSWIERIGLKKFYNGDMDEYEIFLSRLQKIRRWFKFM